MNSFRWSYQLIIPPTLNGELRDTIRYTCIHLSLALGSWLDYLSVYTATSGHTTYSRRCSTPCLVRVQWGRGEKCQPETVNRMFWAFEQWWWESLIQNRHTWTFYSENDARLDSACMHRLLQLFKLDGLLWAGPSMNAGFGVQMFVMQISVSTHERSWSHSVQWASSHVTSTRKWVILVLVSTVDEKPTLVSGSTSALCTYHDIFQITDPKLCIKRAALGNKSNNAKKIHQIF